MRKFKSFGFIGDIIDLGESKTITLFEDFVLKRANDTQIEQIKLHLDSYVKILHLDINRWELDIKKDGNSGSFNVKELSRKDWRYNVVDFGGKNVDGILPISLCLCDLELKILFHTLYLDNAKTPVAQTGNELRIMNFLHDSRLNFHQEKKIISNDFKSQIKVISSHLRELYNAQKEEYENLIKAIKDYMLVDEISDWSPFKIVAYFSILEALLTTNKNPALEISITHQLKKKISLIFNQLNNQIDLKEYFPVNDDVKLETIIGKTYKHRSNIAHGNTTDFQKDLQILGQDKESVQRFLKDITRKILVFSIANPDLVVDLKNC